jgi:hypothetical protein
LRAYYVALGTMLQRVNVQTCAAITRGTIEPAAMSTAMTYIPSEHVLGFQSARVAAIVAAAEGTPSPPLDPEAAEAASERFKSLLGAEGWQHYERIAEATGERSDEDLCWLSRAMLGSVARLPDTEAAVFARILASSAAARGEEGEVAMQARH